MRSNTWTNADGLRVFFGRADTKNAEAGAVETKGKVRQISMDLHYDLEKTEADVKSAVIPAGARIISAVAVVDTAFAGGTSVAVGTITTDGVTADADAVVTDTEAALANLTAGAVITGAGALIGATTSADVNLTYTTTGTFTAGKATLLVEYVL